MRGFPKRINTAQDIEHSFELVRVGQLDPEDLLNALEAIGRQAFLHIPIVSVSQNRRTVTTRFVNEAQAGQAGNVTITNVQHRADPDSSGSMDEGFAFTDLTLSAPLDVGETVILIPAVASPLVELGMTAARFVSLGSEIGIKGASFGALKGAIEL